MRRDTVKFSETVIDRSQSTAQVSIEGKTLYHYLSTQTMLTIRYTQSFSEPGSVKVLAQKGSVKRRVGLLYVYPNQHIPKVIIQPVFIRSRQFAYEIPQAMLVG